MHGEAAAELRLAVKPYPRDAGPMPPAKPCFGERIRPEAAAVGELVLGEERVEHAEVRVEHVLRQVERIIRRKRGFADEPSAGCERFDELAECGAQIRQVLEHIERHDRSVTALRQRLRGIQHADIRVVARKTPAGVL